MTGLLDRIAQAYRREDVRQLATSVATEPDGLDVIRVWWDLLTSMGCIERALSTRHSLPEWLQYELTTVIETLESSVRWRAFGKEVQGTVNPSELLNCLRKHSDIIAELWIRMARIASGVAE